MIYLQSVVKLDIFLEKKIGSPAAKPQRRQVGLTGSHQFGQVGVTDTGERVKIMEKLFPGKVSWRLSGGEWKDKKS